MRGATCLGIVDVARVFLNTVCDAASDSISFVFLQQGHTRENTKMLQLLPHTWNRPPTCIRGAVRSRGPHGQWKSIGPNRGTKCLGCPTGQRAPRGAFAIFGRSGLEQRLAVVETPTGTQTHVWQRSSSHIRCFRSNHTMPQTASFV